MPMNLLWSATIAMVVTLEQMDVGGVSLGSLFQSQESRAHFSSTQVVNDDQAIFARDKYINMTLLYLFWKATEGFPQS